jgi:hypothetical protein
MALMPPRGQAPPKSVSPISAEANQLCCHPSSKTETGYKRFCLDLDPRSCARSTVNTYGAIFCPGNDAGGTTGFTQPERLETARDEKGPEIFHIFSGTGHKLGLLGVSQFPDLHFRPVGIVKVFAERRHDCSDAIGHQELFGRFQSGDEAG